MDIGKGRAGKERAGKGSVGWHRGDGIEERKGDLGQGAGDGKKAKRRKEREKVVTRKIFS